MSNLCLNHICMISCCYFYNVWCFYCFCVVYLLSECCRNDVWVTSELYLDAVSMMSEPCLNDVWKMFAYCLHNCSLPFWCSCCFLLFKFMAGAWVLYLDAVHHSVYFRWFCFCFLSYQESLHAKFVFLAYSFFLSFLLAFFAAVMGEEQWFFTYGSSLDGLWAHGGLLSSGV